MRRAITLLSAIALAGTALVVTAPAKAQVDAYIGSDGVGVNVGDPGYGYDPYYDSYADPYANAYADPYADPYYGASNECDYYTPPWGFPPDYCNYQLWYDPVYYGGAWYSGPFYYRNFGGLNYFWLNGGWRRDGWRGARPGRINWGGRNQFWNYRGQIRRGG